MTPDDVAAMSPQERAARHQSRNCWEHPELQDEHDMCHELSQAEIAARREFLAHFHPNLMNKESE